MLGKVQVDPLLVNFHTWCEIGVQLHSLACGNLVGPAPFGEETIPFPLNGLGTLLKAQLARCMSFLVQLLNRMPLKRKITFASFESISELSSIPLDYMPIFRPVPHCFDYCNFVVSFLKLRNANPLTSFFFFKIVLATHIHIQFHMSLRIRFLFLQKAIGIQTGTTLNLQITLGSTDILIFSLPVNEHEIYFHILRFFLDILFSNSQFSFFF